MFKFSLFFELSCTHTHTYTHKHEYSIDRTNKKATIIVATMMCGPKPPRKITEFIIIESLVPYHVEIIVPINILRYISMERDIYMLLYAILSQSKN